MVSCVPPPLLWSLLLVVVAGHAASAAPCPYNASADMDSLLSQSQALLREAGEEEEGESSQQVPMYARCDPFYEGDIFLNGMEPWADASRDPGQMKPEVRLWPDGVIPYTTAFVDSINALSKLNTSMSDLETSTATEAGPCLQFVPWSPGVSEDFLFITDTLTHCCFSAVGRQGGNQTLNMGMMGNNVGNVKHLLLHALGFWHEHNRPGRDADIEVLWENVQEGLQCFFDEYRNETAFVEETPYDLASVTHISLNTWSSGPRGSGLDTLQPRSPTNVTDIGFRQNLTDLDIQRIRARYNCPVPDTTTTSQPTTAQPPTSATPTTEPTTTEPTTTEPTTTEPTTTEPTTTERTTTEPTTTERTTTFLPPRVVCRDQPDGQMLPYPDDCHKFYKCDGGRDYVCCCPLPLVFSAEDATCVHEWTVPCDTPGQPSECPEHSVPHQEQCRYTHGRLTTS